MTTTTEPLIVPERPAVAAACDMTDAPDTPAERLAEYGRLFAHALVARHRAPGSVTFTFADKAGVHAWVSDLARREAACCPFFGQEVRRDADRVTWRFSMQDGPAADAVLDEIHGLPERFSDGFAGLLQRLRARGVNLVSIAPHRFAIDEGAGARE